MAGLKTTPLHGVQQAHGGRFVPFAGWEMAVQFAGVLAEHRAVRERVGLFDVSHMGEVTVAGPQAVAALQHVLTQDVANLAPGRALYTLMCDPTGGVVDDLIVYREGPERFFACVNASRVDADLAHLRAHCAGFDCQIDDVSAAWALLALQGPAARPLMDGLAAAAVAALGPFAWADAPVAGVAGVRVARTGYTGEHGYELFCPAAQAPALFAALVAAGAPHGLALCGLGARDTLRLEMKYPLYGNDLDLLHDPFEAGLGWAVKLQRGDFVGAAALRAKRAAGPQRRWVGLRLGERGVPRPGYPIRHGDAEAGTVTSGGHSPSLDVGIGVGYVPTALAAVGQPLEILVRGRPLRAEVVATPFYKRGS